MRLRNTDDPRFEDSVCYQRFCCKIEFAVKKKLDMNPSKASITNTFEVFSINHTFVYLLESPRQISTRYVFLKNNMGLSMKKKISADFCADQIDVITNFAVITNVVIKRIHCSSIVTVVDIILLPTVQT